MNTSPSADRQGVSPRPAAGAAEAALKALPNGRCQSASTSSALAYGISRGPRWSSAWAAAPENPRSAAGGAGPVRPCAPTACVAVFLGWAGPQAWRSPPRGGRPRMAPRGGTVSCCWSGACQRTRPIRRWPRPPGSSVTWCLRCRTARPGRRAGGSAMSGAGFVRPNPGCGSCCRRRSRRPDLPRACVRNPGVRHPRRCHRAALGIPGRAIDDAIASYQVFSALRQDGVIPAQLRFQVGPPVSRPAR